MMQLKTSSLIARKFTGYVSGLLLLLGILLNSLFFVTRYRGESTKLEGGPGPKPKIKLFIKRAKNKKEIRLPFIPLLDNTRSIPYTESAYKELQDNTLWKNISIIGDSYIMYRHNTQKNEIKFTYIEEQINAQERLLRMSFMFIITFAIITYLLSHIFVKSSFYRVNSLLEYVKGLNIHNLNTKVPQLGPDDDEIQIIANKLQESLDTIKSQTDNLKQFISYASHELKTPLMSINALMDLGEKTGTYEFVKDKIKNSIQIMNNLIEKLLSQLKQQNESKNWNVNKDKSNINEIALEVINEIHMLFPSHNLKLNQSRKELLAHVSKDNLKTILHNIIQNACKYSKEGSTITIEINNRTISIIDEGIGIDPNNIEKIWGEFYRVNHKKNGHGLGLSLVKNILDQYNRTVKVKSELGKGSKFIIQYA